MNFDDIFKQMKDMQAQLGEAQAALKAVVVAGESGAGLVKVTMNGRFEALRVDIDPSVLGDGLTVLEDLITAAINDAVRRLEGVQKESMEELARSCGLPPGIKLPF